MESIRQRDSLSLSLWQGSAKQHRPAFNAGHATGRVYDCLIVGAGITGITTALLLQQAGQQCVIAEAMHPGFGTTGGTTAHLNTFFDATYPEIESDFGPEAARLMAEGGKAAIQTIDGLVKKLNIACDFEYKPAWLYAENKDESKELQKIFEAAKRAGVTVETDGQNGLPVPFDTAIRFDQQAQFHPLKYIEALTDEFIAGGGLLLENTRVTESSFEDHVHTVKTNRAEIQAKSLVYATHIPPGINLMSFRNAPYRSYVLGLKLKDGNYPEGLAYDMQEPYHYFRTHIIDGQKYLVVGGEDHKTGHADPELAFRNLKAYASRYYQIAEVAYQWSAQYYVPVDGLPYIGQLPAAADSTYMATGFNGNGMILGTLSGKIISDLVLGNENKYASLFKPSRLKPVAGFTEFVKENADVAWHFIADRLTADELYAITALEPREGKLMEFEGRHLAVYKDEQGKITALKPVCTHAGCIVQFNPAEQSWDCPCHGGRYDTNGKVLSGPPVKDLEVVQVSNNA